MSTFGSFTPTTPWGNLSDLTSWCIQEIQAHGTIECIDPPPAPIVPSPPGVGERGATPTPGGDQQSKGVQVRMKFEWKASCFCEQRRGDTHHTRPTLGDAGAGKCGEGAPGVQSPGDPNIRGFWWLAEKFYYPCASSRSATSQWGETYTPPEREKCICYSLAPTPTPSTPPPATPPATAVKWREGSCFGSVDVEQNFTPFQVGQRYCDGECSGEQDDSGLGLSDGSPAITAALLACKAKRHEGVYPPFDSYPTWGGFNFTEIQNVEVADCMNKLICCGGVEDDKTRELMKAWTTQVMRGFDLFRMTKCERESGL
jgi:hypothetical protein